MQSENAQATWFYDGLGWLETHRKQSIQVAGVVVVLAMVISYYFYSRNQKEEAQAAAFSQLILNQAKPEEYIKFQADNHSSQAAPKALLMAGQEYFAMGKYPEAQEQFQKLRQEYRSSAFTIQASLGVAASLDAQGKVDDAIAAYTDLTHQSGDVASMQAGFALGRLYEVKGQLDKALENLDAVAAAAGNSTIGQEAGVHAVEIRMAHPELVKAMPAASAVPPMTPGQ
jgi:tetratricopeptide (TPR) repeat protein